MTKNNHLDNNGGPAGCNCHSDDKSYCKKCDPRREIIPCTYGQGYVEPRYGEFDYSKIGDCEAINHSPIFHSGYTLDSLKGIWGHHYPGLPEYYIDNRDVLEGIDLIYPHCETNLNSIEVEELICSFTRPPYRQGNDLARNIGFDVCGSEKIKNIIKTISLKGGKSLSRRLLHGLIALFESQHSHRESKDLISWIQCYTPNMLGAGVGPLSESLNTNAFEMLCLNSFGRGCAKIECTTCGAIEFKNNFLRLAVKNLTSKNIDHKHGLSPSILTNVEQEKLYTVLLQADIEWIGEECEKLLRLGVKEEKKLHYNDWLHVLGMSLDMVDSLLDKDKSRNISREWAKSISVTVGREIPDRDNECLYPVLREIYDSEHLKWHDLSNVQSVIFANRLNNNPASKEEE